MNKIDRKSTHFSSVNITAPNSFNDQSLDNPNQNAKIGFVIFYPFQFYVFKNVFEHLKNEAEFIIDMGAFYPARQPDGLLEDMVSLLEANRVPFRILYYEKYGLFKYLEDFFEKYGLLTSLWYRGCVRLRCNKLRKKASLAYGAGKALNTFRVNHRKWDLFLSYGNYEDNILRLYTQTEIVGNPKFDDWFNDNLNSEFINLLKRRLDTKKKTVLYLPTHSDLSSIDELAEELKKLSDDFNIIAKLHYYTPRDEPARVQKLTDKGIILFDDGTDLLDLLKVSDVVISDNSSAIFDAVLADKPIVVTDFITSEYLDIEHKRIKKYQGVTRSFALTYSGSIEQRIKKDSSVIAIKTPGELREAISKALNDDPIFKESRARLRSELFAFNDGMCGARAAQALRNLLTTEVMPPKPVLFHVFEAFETETKKRTLSAEREDAYKINQLENLLFEKIEKESNNKKIFSVVVLPSMENFYPEICFRALINQNFPAKSFEIILPESEKVNIGKVTRDLSELPLFKFADLEGLGTKLISNVLAVSEGEIICFTSNSCLLPRGWLLGLYTAYSRHAEVAGFGGYVKKMKLVKSVFDEYYKLELAKRLNFRRNMESLAGYELINNLFYQNPAGTLLNMSYKKIYLESINTDYLSVNLEILSEQVKGRVMAEGVKLGFIALAVTDLNRFTFKKFIRRNFMEGIASSFICFSRPKLKVYYKYNIFSPIISGFSSAIRAHHKTTAIFSSVVGTMSRFIGQCWGKFILDDSSLNKFN